ncbi:C6 zinc finger domain-containing protein [Pleurostoma richardsiae]|uniref:C6 zinc finger domain-containing protein n=1 Tax=Pleurostoma richardsiae TaxID=41990 RepID=A0AA38RCK5_9PEZI|nr:C6 zinc finger domain-containing protein [Pleurostoma richardsiae]
MENIPPIVDKKRRRPPLACERCRGRKVRCDRKSPCENCIRAKKAASCTYVPDPRLRAPRTGRDVEGGDTQVSASAYNAPHRATTAIDREQIDASAHPREPPNGPQWDFAEISQDPFVISCPLRSNSGSFCRSPTSPDSPPSKEQALVDKVKQLEQQLQDLRSSQQGNNIHVAPHHQVQKTTKGMLSKTRYLGQSHWMNGATLFPMLAMFVRKLEADRTSEAYQTLAASKALSKSIKAQRAPSLLSTDFGQHMPQKELADRLVATYFRTFETVYRIVHIPTFWQQYRRFWNNPAAADQAFLMQLQLCMAIGACFHDDNFSLRRLAMRWVYEAQFWTIQPSEKSRMTIPGLQVLCLLHLARETCAIGPDLLWTTAGTLLRMAMYMGLHRDPQNLPRMSLFSAEIRRRLWATILEFCVQSSLDSGGPPLISFGDYDAAPPSNFNDDDLKETVNSPVPAPKHIETMTQVSLQIALLNTLPARLAVARSLNEFNSTYSYEDTLKLHSVLTDACRKLTALLNVYASGQATQQGVQALSPFQLRLVEHSIHRYFLALHIPWLGHSCSDPRYYFSRKMCVETGLRLYRGIIPLHDASTSSHGASPFGGSSSEHPIEQDDFARLSICGSGAFRSVPVQGLLIIGLELLWQTEEFRDLNVSVTVDSRANDSLASTPGTTTTNTTSTSFPASILRGQLTSQTELLEAVQFLSAWTKKRILAGETNFKGHLFAGCLLKEIECLQRRMTEPALETSVMEYMTDTVRECFQILKDMAAAETVDPGSRLTESAVRDVEMGINNDIYPTYGDILASDGIAMETMYDWPWDDLTPEQAFHVNIGYGVGLVFGDS